MPNIFGKKFRRGATLSLHDRFWTTLGADFSPPKDQQPEAKAEQPNDAAEQQRRQEQQQREQQQREQAERDRVENERLAREQGERDRLENERLAREQAERDRVEREILAREQAERDRVERERLAREQAERDRLESERLAREQAERDRLERERLAREEEARLNAPLDFTDDVGEVDSTPANTKIETLNAARAVHQEHDEQTVPSDLVEEHIQRGMSPSNADDKPAKIVAVKDDEPTKAEPIRENPPPKAPEWEKYGKAALVTAVAAPTLVMTGFAIHRAAKNGKRLTEERLTLENAVSERARLSDELRRYEQEYERNYADRTELANRAAEFDAFLSGIDDIKAQIIDKCQGERTLMFRVEDLLTNATAGDVRPATLRV